MWTKLLISLCKMGSISWAEKVSGARRDRPVLNSNYIAGLTNSDLFASRGLFYLSGGFVCRQKSILWSCGYRFSVAAAKG